MKKNMEDRETSPGAKAYSLRMYDLVLGNDQPTQSAKERVSISNCRQSSKPMIPI